MFTTPPCRLSVILAREAPVGVIFRRGPTKWVQIVHWDTATDTFTPGQWFHGSVHGRHSDLSPDGSLMIYFAGRQTISAMASDYTCFWTAISRPPYLTALALWPNFVSWGGGGLFLSNTEIWLGMSEDRAIAHADHTPQGLTIQTHPDSSPWIPIEDQRRARDGWERIREWHMENVPEHGTVTLTPRIDRKQNPHGSQALLLTTSTGDYRTREVYSVEDSTGVKAPLTGVEWADWDHQGRLVFALKGKILTQDADAIGQEPPTELIDLNGNTFENVVAPAWATEW